MCRWIAASIVQRVEDVNTHLSFDTRGQGISSTYITTDNGVYHQWPPCLVDAPSDRLGLKGVGEDTYCLAGADLDVAVMRLGINPGIPDVEYGPLVADRTREVPLGAETYRCERPEGNPRVIELAATLLAFEVG